MLQGILKNIIPSDKNETLVFLTGINMMLLHFIVLQQIGLAINHDEIAVLLFSLSYFSGISLGYFYSHKISKEIIKHFLPLILVLQLLVMLTLQFVVYSVNKNVSIQIGTFHISGDFVSYITVFIWITFGATLMYSIFLPSIIDSDGYELRRSYSIEIAGSICGLLIIPLLASLGYSFLIAGYFISFLIIARILKVNDKVYIAMIVVIFIYLYYHNSWNKSLSESVYRGRYGANRVTSTVYTKYTPYHKIEILGLSNGEFMLLLNGKRQFAAGSHYTYSYYVAELPAKILGSPKVCLLGCGSMSTVGRIGDFVPSVDIVDLDPEVFKTSRRFFQKYNRLNELKNWTFKADDAKHFIATTSKKYDLIIHDIPPAKNRQTALTYTKEFFTNVKKSLTPNGIFSIAALRSSKNGKKYGLKMMATLADVFDNYYAVAYKSCYYFYAGNKKIKIKNNKEIYSYIRHNGKRKVKILSKGDIDILVKGQTIITNNNVGDLIYD